MLILRSQGHLLFSDWTISQRTVWFRAETLCQSCSVVQHLSRCRHFRERDGKSSVFYFTCKRLLKNFFNLLLPDPTSPPLSEGASKNVFRKRLQM
jgi:hypothetical protein